VAENPYYCGMRLRLQKKFSVILENGPAFHGLRSWSFEDKGIPNQEIGNEELNEELRMRIFRSQTYGTN
jgi:hypothetical protein